MSGDGGSVLINGGGSANVGGGPSGCIEGWRDWRPNWKPIAIVLALAACAAQPVEAQLATACNQAATALREAAILRANGKLSPASVSAISGAIPSLEAGCDPASPPSNLTLALANVTQALQTITLQNAGVK